MTFSLDTSALLRFVDREAGADRIEELLDQRDSGLARVIMCAVHWAEVVGLFLRRMDRASAESAISKVEFLAIEIIPLTQDRATQAAQLRHRFNLPFVDAFGLELAYNMLDHHLVTADFDLKPAAGDISIEFLPTKSRP